MNNKFDDRFKPLMIFLYLVESGVLQVFSYVDVRLENVVPDINIAETLAQQWYSAQVEGNINGSTDIFFNSIIFHQMYVA